MPVKDSVFVMAEPVYPIIKEQIEQAIRNGEWSDRLPGTFQLARRFGTSHLTVLKAIKLLKEDGKVIVKERQGTYIVRGDAPRPFSPYIGVVGCSPDANVPPLALEHYYLQAIKNYLEAHGFKMLSIQHFDESDSYFTETLTNMRINGYLFTNSILTQESAERLMLEGVPFVSLNRIDKIDGITCVDFDHEEGLRCLLRHFLACGHKRIAMARQEAPFKLTHIGNLLRLYREILQAAGVYHPELLHIYDNNLIFRSYRDSDAAEAIAEDMFKQYYCCENPPSALHIEPSNIACAFLRKIRDEAPDWAKSLALSTVSGSMEDDDALSTDFCCTIFVDYAELARIGVEVLAHRIANPRDSAQKVSVPLSFRIHRKVTPNAGRKKRVKHVTR